MLEWFDFGVFAYFAAEIGARFFPQESHFAQLLMGFSVFAVAYFMRPVGGILFGWIGDKVGRKAMLRYSILMMGIASFCIGLLPGYATIGVAAPVLLVLLRMIQGLSVGGEYTGSMTLTTELADTRRRGFISASATAGVAAGLLLASGVSWLVRDLLGPEQLAAWGWRIPFLCGLVILATGAWLRRHIPEYEPVHADAGPPPSEHVLVHAFKKHWRVMLMITLIVAPPNAAFYLTNIWLVDLLQSHTHHGAQIQGMETIAMGVALFCPMLGGWMSDLWGRRPVLIVLTILLGVLSWPLLLMVFNGGPASILIALCIFTVLETTALGVHGVLLVEMTPVHARTSVFGISYNFAMAVFGGLIPAFAMLLAHRTVPGMAELADSPGIEEVGPMSVMWSSGYEPISVVWIPIVLSAIALVVLVCMKETRDRRIDA